MATLTIRDIDDDIRDRLRVRAAQHGRSMEAEVREILRDAVVRSQVSGQLGSRVRQRFSAAGGVELSFPYRDAPQRSVDIE